MVRFKIKVTEREGHSPEAAITSCGCNSDSCEGGKTPKIASRIASRLRDPDRAREQRSVAPLSG